MLHFLKWTEPTENLNSNPFYLQLCQVSLSQNSDVRIMFFAKISTLSWEPHLCELSRIWQVLVACKLTCHSCKSSHEHGSWELQEPTVDILAKPMVLRSLFRDNLDSRVFRSLDVSARAVWRHCVCISLFFKAMATLGFHCIGIGLVRVQNGFVDWKISPLPPST